MTLRTHPDLEQRSDEWYRLRAGIVTASITQKLITVRSLAAINYPCPECDAPEDEQCRSKVRRNGVEGAHIKTPHAARAEVADMNRDRSRLIVEPARNTDTTRDLAYLLASERITGRTEPGGYISDAMWRGIEDEPRARDAYAQQTAQQVTEVGFITEDRWGYTLGYSPDGLVGPDGLIEIKSREPKAQVRAFVEDRIPTENMAQLQTGLLVTGRAWLDYVSYCAGEPLFIRRVHPDPAWHTAIRDAAAWIERTTADICLKYEAATWQMPKTERIEIPTEMRL